MAIRVVIQARLSSSRLPAKAMLSLRGAPLAVRVAQRAANTGLDAVVATSTHPDDDLLAAAVESAGLRVMRGSLEDPLARFAAATADMAETDIVVRYTADNAFPDGHLAETLAAAVAAERPYARIGGSDRSLPYGVSGEAFTVGALRAADRGDRDPRTREHVTPWIREHFEDRVLRLEDTRPEWGGLRCTVDAFDDYVLVSRVFARVPDPVAATWQELVEALGREARPLPRDPMGPTPHRFVLGTAQLGSGYGIANTAGAPTAERATEILYAARSEGVAQLDTARAYGDSEARIGSALRRGLSEHLEIVTKVRPLGEAGDAANAVRASLFESLEALGARSVEALLVHRAKDWFAPGARAELLDLRARGRTRLLGASLATPEELLDLLDDDAVGYVQLPFNLLDRRWLRPDVARAIRARPDVVFAVRSVFLQGLLLLDDPSRWPRNTVVDQARLRRALMQLVGMFDRESPADLALAYVRSQEWIDAVVIGAETTAQVRDLARLFRRAPLQPGQAEQLESRMLKVDEILIDPSRWELS